MSVFHAQTRGPPWTGAIPPLVDERLRSEGSKELSLDWTRYDYEDGEHFTEASARAFCDDLVDALEARCRWARRVWIFTDSTIGHNDYEEGAWTGAASARLASSLGAGGVDASVDAVCGSGFAAMSAEGLHFAARIAARRRRGADPPDAVVFVGGWNDDGRSESAVSLAIAGACRAARAAVR